MEQENIYSQVGKAVKKIALKLFENKELLKLLQDMSDDPFNNATFKVDNTLDFKNGNIRTVPNVDTTKVKQGAVVILPYYGETEDNFNFSIAGFTFDIFLPIDKWSINNEIQRPYEIASRIYNSMNGSRVTGIGLLRHDGFDLKIIDDNISLHSMKFTVDTVG